ncbi:hypothetical protein PRZ48_010370 [Zasmidium cellare]|uniref:Uncharacterized protein n=1 Tax=Zasmidium cellare TaxID=395010 RepID=A0ABR0E8F5_ZASCE|nr:hypothetical protein PRZ48_010370 [Zasmidium cellare]
MSLNSLEPDDAVGWQAAAAVPPHKAAQKTRKPDTQDPLLKATTSNAIQPPHVAATDSTQPKVTKGPNSPAYSRPHKYDRIFTAARHNIINYNRQSLAHFTDPLRVEATASVATEYQNDESNKVTLALVGHKKIERLQFKLVRGHGAKARIDVLMCFDGEKWKTLDAYLATLKAPNGYIRRGVKGIEQQQAWWAKNGKSFRFLDLPAELHDEVFKHLIPRNVYPVLWANGIVPFGHGSERLLDALQKRYRHHDSTHKTVPQPDIALVGTCRQLKTEVDRYLEIETTKSFRDRLSLSNFIKKVGDPEKFNNFSHVELDFDHADYFHFFQVEVQPFPQMEDKFDEYKPRDLAAMLRDLPHIKSITLRFTSPFDALTYDPFGYTGSYHNDLDWYHDWKGNRDQDGFATSCQKTVVDWILTYAKEYIAHIPEIKLEGAIKHSTKMKWDLIFKDEKNGIAHDMTEAKEAIREAEGQPTCFCTNTCTHYAFQPIAHSECCPSRACHCRRGNINARFRYYDKDLKEYKFDFED